MDRKETSQNTIMLYSHQPLLNKTHTHTHTHTYMHIIILSKSKSHFFFELRRNMLCPLYVLTNKYQSKLNKNENHLLDVNRIFISRYFFNQFIHVRKVRVKAKIREISYNCAAPLNCGNDTILTISVS